MFSLQDEIQEILTNYLSIDSVTETENEKKIDQFFCDYIDSVEYFKNHPHYSGSEKIPGDPLDRKVHWAMIEGRGDKTIVLVHHSDVVHTENYNELAPFAFSPERLSEELKGKLDALDSEASKDLLSELWIFGRGSADMKGGGAIQLAILKELSLLNKLKGNVVLLMVPDEENLSAGMRHGVKILKRLKEEHKLDYQLMINSEPHQRVNYDKGIISQGSIAKMNFFVCIKGILTHAGKVLEGVNPVGMMSQIISETELSLDFVDEIDGEMSIPPTWIHVKDSKNAYDISTPESIIGYMNVLNFSTSPEEIINKLKKVCLDESDKFINKYISVYEEFKKKTRRESNREKWKINIVTFDELLDLVRRKGNDSYNIYEKYRDQIIRRLKQNKLTFIEADQLIVDQIIKIINRQEVFIIIGLSMPLYPAVSNIFRNETVDYLKIINDFTKKEWGQTYMNRHFFTGISDLSYSSLNYDLKSTLSQMNNMPLWNHYYSIPFEDIKFIQMPCINIGPWGKDFHKISERVYREDLLVRTPLIIKKIIQNIL
jgi:arginine utilization protein RocB